MDGTTTSMRAPTRRKARQALVVTGLLLVALTASADHTAVSALLPPGYHSEEALTWCGPATGQMVIAGYPSSACTKVQADVDASIQAHKVESAWDADPEGLRAAMMEQCPPPGGHWVVFSQADATQLMHSAAYWMTRNQYPVAMLLGTTAHNSYAPHQEHWVAVTAIVTDLDPTTNATVTLTYVQFVDPSPISFGDPPVVRFVTGTVWYSQLSAVTKASSAYNGKFVAVIEPPRLVGRAIATGKLMLTGTVIPKAQASRLAVQAIQNLKLAELPLFREFAEAKALEPLLINGQRGGYYLIPFSLDGKSASLAIIVNAYNGDFQEAGHFGSRVFMSRDAALEHVRMALRLQRPIQPAESRAELVSSPEAGTPYAPEWRITVGTRTLQIDPGGRVRAVEARSQPR